MTEKRRVVRNRRNSSKIRYFRLGQGLPVPDKIRDELFSMRNVLLGHVDPPVQMGIITLMEVAEAFFSRACDMEQQILRAEQEGRIAKASPYHTLRTQEIRSFKEMSKSAADLGSRRITAESLRLDQESRGRESV